MAALAERRRACAGWLAWATALVAALWIQVVPRTPGRSVATALILTAGMAGAAGLAALGGRLRRSHLIPLTGAVLLSAAVLSGTLGPWLGALAVPGMAAGLGLILARLWLGEPAPALVTLALGLAALSLVGFAALASGVFSLWLFAAVAAAAWALHAVLEPRALARRSPSSGPGAALSAPERAGAGFLWALLVSVALHASVPDCCFDPVWVHLPLAEAIAEHRYRLMPEVWWTAIPLGYHVLAAVAYGIGGGMAAKLLHTVFLLLAAGWAVWWGARLHGLLAGLISAVLFLTIPLVMWDGAVGNTDMAAAFFGVAGVTAFFEFLGRGGRGWLFLAGALVGTATAIKPFSVALAVPLGLVFLFGQARQPGRRKPWAAGLLLAAGIVLTAGPWFARTWLVTGNPVFPLLHAIGHQISRTHLGGHFGAPYEVTPESGEAGSAGVPWTIGFPWTVKRVLALPLLLTFRSSVLAETPDGAMGTYPLLWLPLLVVGWPAVGPVERRLLVVAAGYFACVAGFAPNPRFLLPCWLLLAVVLGTVLARSPLLHGWTGRIKPALVAAVLLAGLAYSLVAWLSMFPAWASLDYLSGRIDRESFLRRTVPALDIFADVQRLVPAEAPVIVDGLYTTYYAKRYLLPSWLPSVRPLFRPDLSPDEARDLLRARGLRYFLAPSAARYRLLDLGLARPLVSEGGFTLYELAPP